MSDAILSPEEIENIELLGFDDLHKVATTSTGLPTGYIRKKKTLTPEIVLPTAAELEAMQNEAREEGYNAAYNEAYSKGTQRMASLLDAIGNGIAQAQQDVAQNLLDLALETARQMVIQTLAYKPDVVLNVIREAVDALPHVHTGVHLVVHPEDAAIIRQHMGEQLNHNGWKILEDASITPGGARIETSSSQVDATVETRWKRIVSALGQESEWIQE